jgi:hypothetical protein
MPIDIYTRVVLTGILVCLAWLCVVLTPVGTPALAQAQGQPAPPVQNVRIVSISRPVSVNLLNETVLTDKWDSLPTTAAK